jgi:hypothetical protein
MNQQRQNKALHPTAYSSVRRSSSLRFRRRVSLVVLQYGPMLNVPDTGFTKRCAYFDIARNFSVDKGVGLSS